MPLSPIRGWASRGIALNGDGSLLYVAEGFQTQRWNGTQCTPPSEPPSGTAGAVAVYDTASRTRVARLPFIGGAGPIHTELDASTGTVYAAGSGGASGSGVDAYQGLNHVAYLPMVGLPHHIGIDTTSGRAIVSNTLQNVSSGYSLIDARAMTLLGTADSGLNAPHKIAVDSARHLAYLSHANDAAPDVSVVDIATGNVLRRISPPGSVGCHQSRYGTEGRRIHTGPIASRHARRSSTGLLWS